MKRTVILALALCAAVVALVCTSVDFDNPLDESGNNFLFGEPRLLDQKEEAIRDNGGGKSNLFDENSPQYYEKFMCDISAPTVKLKGANSETIESNEIAKFQRLMGNGPNGFADVIEWSDGNVSAKLTTGGGAEVMVPPNGMPPISTYPAQFIIVYTAQKGMCQDGSGITPPPGEATRGLVINEARNITTQPPIVVLNGSPNINVPINGTYEEPGVRAYEADGVTQIPITKVELWRGGVGGNLSETWTGADPVGSISVPTGTLREYALVYYTKSLVNDSTASAARTVNIVSDDQFQPTPVIELNTYTHRIDGVTINHPDTAIRAGGAYRELGIKRVYYVTQDGAEVPITAGITTSTPGSLTNPGQTTVTYTVAAGPGYRAGTITRNILIYESDCDMSNVRPPVITFTDGSDNTLTLSASSGRWNAPQNSYRVATGSLDNEEPNPALTRRYMIDFGGLDPDNLKAGTYTVRYVGLSQCGAVAMRARTVIVQ